MEDQPNPILMAMENHEPLEVIRGIVEGNPDQLRRRDDGGFLPIHHAIDRIDIFGLDLALCLLEAWPESIQERVDDEYKYLPAHILCVNAGWIDMEELDELRAVRAVVEAYPQALQEKDGEGNLPLHLAFRRMPSPLVVTRYLVEIHPPGLRERNDFGNVPFHDAVRSHEPRIPDLQFLYGQWPECIRQRNDFGYVPFFVAATNPIIAEGVLRYLHALWPDSIHQKDNRDWTPLHLAARTRSRTAVEYLLRTSPELARQKTDLGRLPLHDAASVGGCAAITEQLVDAFPESVREASNDGMLALHEAANEGKIDVVRYLVAHSPSTIRAETNKGWLPIHVALQFRPWNEPSRQGALDVVQLLVGQFPESVWSATEEGYLPLHVAAGLGDFGRHYLDDDDYDDQLQLAPRFELDLVQLLVVQAPISARIFSEEGMLPVHCAIRGGHSWEAIQYLFDSFPEVEGIPESVQYKTSRGTPVLHLAIDRDMYSLEFVELLVEHRRHVLEDTDESGFTPMHYAVKRTHLTDVWRFLVAQRPRSLRQGDREGSLPLHVYLRSLVPLHFSRSVVALEEVRFLVEEYPGALQVANDLGNLPLHVAVYQRRVPLEVVKLLVDASPPSLRHRNGQGLLPLHVAAQGDGPLDVLYQLASADPESIYHELRPIDSP